MTSAVLTFALVFSILQHFTNSLLNSAYGNKTTLKESAWNVFSDLVITLSVFVIFKDDTLKVLNAMGFDVSETIIEAVIILPTIILLRWHDFNILSHPAEKKNVEYSSGRVISSRYIGSRLKNEGLLLLVFTCFAGWFLIIDRDLPTAIVFLSLTSAILTKASVRFTRYQLGFLGNNEEEARDILLFLIRESKGKMNPSGPSKLFAEEEILELSKSFSPELSPKGGRNG